MQRYFLDSDAPAFLSPPSGLIPNIVKLIDTFRQKSRPIIFTRHAHTKEEDTGQMSRWWKNELPLIDDSFSEIIPNLKPEKSDLVITKSRYSAFENTNLDSYLKSQKIQNVVICGVMTNLCVETTARHAFMKDFQPIIVEDACATKNIEFHKASLLNLGYGFAHIIKTNDVIHGTIK